MLRAVSTRSGPIAAADADDQVILDFDDRHRRRLAMTAVGGLAFLLDLADTPSLADGDGLELDDGRLVRVVAKPERLAEFTIGDPLKLARVAWHLGNRHTPVEIHAAALRIRDDYVLVELVKKLGADEIAFMRAPFNPERGAYGHGATMPHDHAPRPKAKAHAHAGHIHGADCGCDHDHGHGHGHAHDHAKAEGCCGGHHHDHAHDHAHPHDHARDHKHAHAHEHAHGADCGCGHKHD